MAQLFLKGWKAQEPSCPAAAGRGLCLNPSTLMALVPCQVGLREALRPFRYSLFNTSTFKHHQLPSWYFPFFLNNNFSKLETHSLLQWIMLKPSRFRALSGKIGWNKSFCPAGLEDIWPQLFSTWFKGLESFLPDSRNVIIDTIYFPAYSNFSWQISQL